LSGKEENGIYNKWVYQMTSRERVRCTLDHTEPDKIPIDFGGTDMTCIHVSPYNFLKQKLGKKSGSLRVFDTFQMMVEIEDELLQYFESDVAPIRLPYTVFGYKIENWKPFTMPDGTEVLVPGGFTVDRLSDGSLVQYPQGDRTASPSGKMPSEGYYFDIIPRQRQFDEIELNAVQWVEETYNRVREEDLRYLEDTSKTYFENTDYALVADLNPGGFGGVIPLMAPQLKSPRGIRNPDQFWLAYLSNKEFIEEVFHLQYELQMENLKQYKQAFGDRIDVMIMCKTDFGTQTGPMISPDLYRELFKPLHSRMMAWVHENTRWKTFFHSCGDVSAFIPDFIDAGLDILNPVQISAKNMKPEFLKMRFGKELVFWGGGINTQHTLPLGTPDEVEKEVKETIRSFKDGGGFVFCGDQNIQPHTPVDNIIRMVDTYKQERQYTHHAQ
jgi:hypothetical protein